MFDANMRHIAKGERFFGEVYQIAGSELSRLGVQVGDVIECQMLSESTSNPTVLFMLPSGDVHIEEHTDFYRSFIVYSGMIDGTDFISDISRAKAMKIIALHE